MKNNLHIWVQHLLFAFLSLLLTSCKNSQSVSNQMPPEVNRFTTTVMTQPGELDEPMAFTFLNRDRLMLVERKGGVKVFDIDSRELKTTTTIPVNTKYTNADGESREAEEGLMGVIADPDFQNNRWVYLFYADPDTPKHVLARWDVVHDSLISSSKKIMLEFPTQRELCCHTGGGMVFDSEGNLYLTTGNNTANPPQGTSNLDERPGMKNHDDQRTAGSTNDLRGKILRIHPERDGSYTIPEGNLFPPGTDKTRPEIYTMGHRNPWRVSIDSKSGYIYWGEVGPDASKDSTIGPRGYDEYNQAKAAGFFGWPYFIGDNKAYADYDYSTGSTGSLFDTSNVINNSPNNTGLQKLPKPEKAFIWYPYANSDEFPEVGSSGRSATGGPVFRMADFAASGRRFPAYFEGKWLIVEFMRGWIMSVAMNEQGDYQSMERFLPDEDFQSAIDIKFSPDGDLYVLEYGSAWFRGNINAQVKRIEYNGGNRTPVVVAGVDKIAGALPLAVQLSSDGTMDYDNDHLAYEWNIHSENGFQRTINDANPQITFEKEGNYQVNLKVTDGQGASNFQAFEILAGNELPSVDLVILQGNQSFFFPGDELVYKISVYDREDGNLESGLIEKSNVAINFDYAPEGFDPIEIAQNHRASDEWTAFSKGAVLINQNDCRSCHLNDQKSVGPSYLDVAAKYKNDRAGQEIIASKIITGGTGIWGEHAMSAHPQLSKEDASLMVSFIMSLDNQVLAPKSYPLEGSLVPEVPKGDNGKGGYLLRVAYRDQGSGKIKSLASEKIIALRNPVLDPEKYDLGKGIQLLTTPSRSFNLVGDEAYLAYKDLDLSGIDQIEFLAQASPRVGAAGAIIEVRLNSPDGQLISQTEFIEPKDVDRRAIMQKLREEKAKSANPDAPIDFSKMARLSATIVQAKIEAINGKHDIYFVFRNPAARKDRCWCKCRQLNL
ncbi:MAG: PQQ-dependent sugar dehydrogenase [Saprospiraceae bacterium]|nr:PQQ-dependent sugar dehydrogenase [Saprospiraceae bacterium]